MSNRERIAQILVTVVDLCGGQSGVDTPSQAIDRLHGFEYNKFI